MRTGIIFNVTLAAAGLMSCLPATAQLAATVDTVRFGSIFEAEGPKTVRMHVKNTTQEPTAILKVRPTCGCTAADFMKEEIAPGDSAWIDLTYDPERRPGRFEKGVKIYPVEGEMIRVPISGVVFSSPETISAMFPVESSLLHLSENTLMTLSPLAEEKRTLWLDVYNSGPKPVWIRLESDSDALTAQPFPSPVPPGEKGMVGIYIDPAKENRSGRLEYRLLLHESEEGPDSTDATPPCEIKIYSEKP